MQQNYIGIEIGGTKLQIVVGDGAAKILERHRFTVDRVQGAEGIRKQIEETLGKIVPGVKPAAIGVGFGGPVDWKAGKICKSHQIEGWSEFDMVGWIKGLANVPVVVDNDANVAALGEALHGAGVGFNPAFYVTLGSGVGGGLVLNGSIYHGAKPGESEIGHVRLDRRGTILESRCSGWAVDARIRELKERHPESLLCKLTEGATGGEAKHLASALQQKDAVARKLLEKVTEDLAFGLSHVVHLFHPEVLVIGGGLSHVGEPLRAAVERALEYFIMGAFKPGPRILLAGLGEDAVPVGALELARQVK
ncbi:ROK family protein [Pedosphaera parvula]|uniref:ROK family protein n=1 Tax=Pedosphaera parvula (strain Ellin514) TaxID=320771 RepID=B9XGZ4_PEDPL|nr:ROK family protein [Pedosphaera parvula]EEF60915.1 ROK family protein [Pedosphaera parvula Ellin514]